MMVGAVSIVEQSVLSGEQMRIEHKHLAAIHFNRIKGGLVMNTDTKTARYKLAIPALILSVIGLSACSMLTPQTTRTGEIHDVKVEEGLAPAIIDVRIGDEVRWVNHRTLPVQIDFIDKNLDGVSCHRGFTNWIGMKTESSTVGPSKSVSVCFSKTGVIPYNVRMESALPGGKQIVKGEIRVGDPSSAAAAY